MNNVEMNAVRTEMTNKIAETIENPALWLLALRQVAVELRLNVTRCIPLAPSSLEIACDAVLSEANKQGRTATAMREAIAAIVAL